MLPSPSCGKSVPEVKFGRTYEPANVIELGRWLASDSGTKWHLPTHTLAKFNKNASYIGTLKSAKYKKRHTDESKKNWGNPNKIGGWYQC